MNPPHWLQAPARPTQPIWMYRRCWPDPQTAHGIFLTQWHGVGMIRGLAQDTAIALLHMHDNPMSRNIAWFMYDPNICVKQQGRPS